MKTSWVIPVLVLTVVCILVYVVSQQILRESANDPQIRMAEDIAASLTKGKNPSDYNLQDKVDISKSLSPYIMIYDPQGRPIASTGILDNAIPLLPSGVFDSAKKVEDRITWRPRSHIRSALVVVSYPGGFVAVGRSLREIQKRIHNMLLIISLFWTFSVIIVLITSLVRKKISLAQSK